MGLTLHMNTAQLELTIRQHGERAVKGVAEKMRRRAIKIRDLAREFAPEDTKALVNAINYMDVRDPATRRKNFVVFVDPDYVANLKTGKLVAEYALLVERHMAPYGTGMLGDRPFHKSNHTESANKPRAGGKFLARAVKEGTRGLEEELADEVRRILRGGATTITNNSRFMSLRDYGGSGDN